MRIRSFVFPSNITGSGIEETQAVDDGTYPIEITLAEAVEWYWRYRELDVSSTVSGDTRTGTALGQDETGMDAGLIEKQLLYPAAGRSFSMEEYYAMPELYPQNLYLDYFHPGSPDGDHWLVKPSFAIQPAFDLRWQNYFESLGGLDYVSIDMTSRIDTIDPLELGYTTMNATVFGKTIPMAGTAIYDDGGTPTAFSLSGATLTVTPSKWFEYKKADESLPVWEETSGAEILDPLTASVP